MILKRFSVVDGHFGIYIVGAYLVEHLAMGVLLGLVAGRIPHVRQTYLEQNQNLLFPLTDDNGSLRKPFKRKRRFHGFFLVFGIFMFALLLLSYLYGGQGFLPQHKVLTLLIRSTLVLFVWYFLLAPILTRLFKKWLQRKRNRLSEEMERILDLLPQTQSIIEQSWRRSNARRGWPRFSFFIKISVVNLFTARNDMPSK